MHRFQVQVRDAAGKTAKKSFDLAVRKALIAVPSRRKVGLAVAACRDQPRLGHGRGRS